MFFKVEANNDSTYFVTGSESTYGVWVHNTCAPRFQGASKLTLNKLDVILKSGVNTSRKGVTEITQPKSRSRDADFDHLTVGSKVTQRSPTFKMATLPDGNKVIYRFNSSGRPTIEIQKPNGKAAIKIRYGD